MNDKLRRTSLGCNCTPEQWDEWSKERVRRQAADANRDDIPLELRIDLTDATPAEQLAAMNTRLRELEGRMSEVTSVVRTRALRIVGLVVIALLSSMATASLFLLIGMMFNPD